MGCQSCKTKNENNNSIMNSIPNNLNSENIFIRIIAFTCVMFSLPFIFIVLLGQIFIAFFLPKFYNDISKKFNDVYMKIIKKNTSEKSDKYSDNLGYEENSKLLDIEVYDDNNEIEK